MQLCKASRLGNTTVLAMYVAVVLRASTRYILKVTATGKAGRRAFGVNAVSDGGGAEERSSAAIWANERYSLVSMNNRVEGVSSLRNPDNLWRWGRECSVAQHRELVEMCNGLWGDVWVWSVSNLSAVKH